MRSRIWMNEQQKSDQLSFLCEISFHRVRAPYWPNATILPSFNPSTPDLTSFWGRCRYSLPVALLISLLVQQPSQVRSTATFSTRALCFNLSAIQVKHSISCSCALLCQLTLFSGPLISYVSSPLWSWCPWIILSAPWMKVVERLLTHIKQHCLDSVVNPTTYVVSC